ncbi:MAG: nicotinate phosphoribosyltransferase [Thermoguttaceae bacterium]
MNTLAELYKPSLGLLTDLYQMTMAYGYWKTDKKDLEAVFHLFFRQNPFRGGFTIAAGLATAIEYLENLHFDQAELECLSTLRGNDDKPLFDRAFLEYLSHMQLLCDVDAVPEGTAVFPNEPLLRVKGPLVQAQLLESAMLNIINFQTLIATKAARVVMAAAGDQVIEFGLRRAQGIDGALSAARAAYIGGCQATSNVLAGRIFGIPVKGTIAHSWVMCFDDELTAFRTFAQAMPNNCIFLVDTYDTLQGVRNATVIGQELRRLGHEMIGIRLDSGDLAWLSIQAREILDDAGFPNAVILASNDLDENIIVSLKEQGAKIDAWGVGTRLVTGHDDPALGGVYKLSGIRRADGPWEPKIKLSEQAAKISNPGVLQVRRYRRDGECAGDVIFDENHPVEGDCTMVDPFDVTRRKVMPIDAACEDLLVPILRRGQKVYQSPALAIIRQRTGQQLAAFHGGIKRFVNPHQYPVGLELGLNERKQKLILEARGFNM